MPRKNNIHWIVPVLVGIIVLLGVYIIVNSSVNSSKKQVTFAVPEVTREIIIDNPYVKTDSFFQPTYFNPNHNPGNNLGNNFGGSVYIMNQEPFSFQDLVSNLSERIPSFSPNVAIPSAAGVPAVLNEASQRISMTLPDTNDLPVITGLPDMNITVAPMDSSPDTVTDL